MSGSADAGRLLVRIEATTAQLRQQLAAAEKQVSGTATRLDTELKKGDKAFGRLNEASRAAQQSVAGLTARLGPLGGALTSLGPVGLAAGVALGTIGAALIPIAQAGDRATAALNRLSAATGSLREAERVYQSLFDLSQQTGIAVAESAGSFTRFSVAAREIGGTTDQVLKLVSGIQKAGIVSGASMQETASATQQLGQALASGVLQGDELRSLLENMPVLAQSLARELGVGIGELRKMGSEGQLTADVIFPALLAASEKMNDEFEKMAPTMGRAFDVLGGAMVNFAAQLDKALGLSQAIAAAAMAAAGAVRAITPATPSQAAASEVASRQSVVNELRQRLADGADRSQFPDGAAGDRLFAAARANVDPRLEADLRAAEQALRESQSRQNDILQLGREEAVRIQGEAAIQAAENARKAAEDAYKALTISENRQNKIRADAAKAREAIDKAEAERIVSAEQAAAARQEVNQKEIDDLAKLAAANDNVTTAVRGRGEAEKEAAKAAREASKEADDAAKRALASQEKARQEAQRAVERFNGEVERESREVARDVATNLFDSITDPSRATSVEDFFKNIFRRIAIQALTANIVLPITSGIVGTLPGMFGINAPGQQGAGGFAGGLSNIGGMFSSGLSSLTTGAGNFGNLLSGGTSLNQFMFGTPGQSFADLGGITTAGTSGLLGSGGSFTMAGLGTTLGGIGGGFGIGSTLGGFIANSPAQQQNSQIGAALGSIIGSAFGPIGSLIGGALGGAGGGLIGPGAPSEGFSYALRGDGENLGAGVGGQLRITDRFENQRGAAQLAQAEQAVAAINAFLSDRGLTVQGARAVGGNKDGMGTLGLGEASSFGGALESLRFGAADNAGLGSYLSGQSFDDPAKLQAAVDGFLQAQAAIEALGAESVPAFTAQMKAVNDNFDAASEQARKYGLAEDNLTSARARAIASLEDARAETLRQAGVSLDIRAMLAAGDSEGAELARQAEAAANELTAFTAQLDDLAATAADKAALLVRLESVQAAERAAIIERFGGQASNALRAALAGDNLLRDLTFGSNSALAPEQQYFAALTSLNQAQRDLEGGGSLSDYAAIASQVLPEAADFLGRSSTRYADLTAQIGNVVASNGGDAAGLSQFLNASVGGMENLNSTFAAYGEQQLRISGDTLTELKRLVGQITAIMTRQQRAA